MKMLGGGVGWGEGVDKMIEYARFAREKKSLGLWFWWILQKRPQSNVYFTPKFLPPACYRWIVLKMHQSSVYVSPSPFPPPILLINPLLKMNPLKWPQSIIPPSPTPLPIKPLQSCAITDFTPKFLSPACYRWIVLKMQQSSVYVSPSPFPPPFYW